MFAENKQDVASLTVDIYTTIQEANVDFNMVTECEVLHTVHCGKPNVSQAALGVQCERSPVCVYVSFSPRAQI